MYPTISGNEKSILKTPKGVFVLSRGELCHYLILGSFGLWHPGWIIFFLLPIVGVLSGDESCDDEDDD